MAFQSTVILSHPPSSRFPPNRTTLSFHTLPKPARILSLTGSTRTVPTFSPAKLFPSSSLTAGSTRTVTALSLFPSFALTGWTRTVTALTLFPSFALTGSIRTVTALSLFPSFALTGSTRTVTALTLFPSFALTGSTRTVTAPSPSKLVASKISPLSLLKPNNTLSTAAALGPLFFAPISDGSAPGAQIAVIVAGLARRCIEIYTRVLVIRILLSLYPNMEWDKQPMSAIRDLCDPFLGLLRGIIPPLFNSVGVRPILAFLLLGMLWLFAKSPTISL